MKIYPTSRPGARARWAAVAALSLLAAGLPSAALAGTGDRATFSDRSSVADRPPLADRATASATPSSEGSASIKGKVVIPPTAVADDEIYADTYYFDEDDNGWRLGEYEKLDPTGDGTFEITGLTPGVEYRLALDIYVDGYASGFYVGPGKPLVRYAEIATGVSAPSSGYVLNPVVATSMSGTFSVPDGFDWSAGPFKIVGIELTPDGEAPIGFYETTVTESSNGKFTLERLWPGSIVVIGASDEHERFAAGGYHAGVDGLVAEPLHATPVLAGSTVHLAIRSTNAVPRLTVVTAPQVSGLAVVGETLESTPGWWSVPGVNVAYQWLRDGAVISGATASSYTLARADIGSKVAVRVTASHEEFPSVVVTSSPTAVVPRLAAPRATTSPVVSGKVQLGSTLRATSGSWSLPGVKVTYQWLRNGKAIKGATSAKYKLKNEDVRKRVSVRVTASLAGHVDGVAASSAKKVAKGKPKVTVKAKKVKAGKRAKLVVKVKAAGLAKPRGTVIVKYGKKKIRVKLTAKRKGKVVVRLPKLSKGKYKIKVTYKPNVKSKKFVTKATSKNVTLRVR